MSITRINEFNARSDKAEALRTFLASIVPQIASAAGCQSCRLLQSDEDPTRFLVLEVWDSIEAHQSSASGIPPEAIERVMQLLAGPPKGGYYIDHETR